MQKDHLLLELGSNPDLQLSEQDEKLQERIIFKERPLSNFPALEKIISTNCGTRFGSMSSVKFQEGGRVKIERRSKDNKTHPMLSSGS